MSNLILPGDLEFEETLGTIPPPNWQQKAYKEFGHFCFIADSDSGILRVASYKETEEYLYGGEYDKRLARIDECQPSPIDLELGINWEV